MSAHVKTETTLPSHYELETWLKSGGHRGWKIPEDCSGVVRDAALRALISYAVKEGKSK